jgi:hypothetical protein
LINVLAGDIARQAVGNPCEERSIRRVHAAAGDHQQDERRPKVGPGEGGGSIHSLTPKNDRPRRVPSKPSNALLSDER